jgi:hypothetical protein
LAFKYAKTIAAKIVFLSLFHPGKDDEATTDNEGIDHGFIHQCGPKDHLVGLTILDKTNIPDFMRSNLPELFKQVIIGSTQKKLEILIAIPLSNPPEKENIRLNNPENPQVQLTFSNLREKHVRLDLDREKKIDSKTINGNIDRHDTGQRAMTDTENELSDEELLEFLQLINTATFAFFTIERERSYY